MRGILGLSLAAVALALPASAAARDRDHDGLPDAWERKHHLSVKKNGANGDPDRDGVDNRNELREGTKPRKRDSDRDRRPDGREDRDRDGLSNAAEDLTGNDPMDRDSDDDGVRDGREAAGVVTAIEGSLMRVELSVGGTVSAHLTEDTELECETENSAEAGYARVARRPSRRNRSRRRGRARHSAVIAQLEDEDIIDDEIYDEEEEELDGEDYSEGEDEEADEAEEGIGSGDCPAGVLAPGARVRNADLDLGDDGLQFEYIAILR